MIFGPKMAKIHTKSGYGGPRSDDRRVFMPPRTLSWGPGVVWECFWSICNFLDSGEKNAIFGQNGPNTHKIGISGPKIGRQARFYGLKYAFLGSGSGLGVFFAQFVIFAFWGENAIFGPKMAKNTHKIGISGPKIGRQARFYGPKNAFLGSGRGLGVFFLDK